MGAPATPNIIEGTVECPNCGQVVDLEQDIIINNSEGAGGEGIRCRQCPQKGDNK